MSKKQTTSWGDEVSPDGGGGVAMQLWQYAILAIAAAVFAIVFLVGFVVYRAMEGNMTAIILVAVGGSAIVILGSVFMGLIASWATMGVNQKQDERAANQTFKYTQMMMQQGQIEANKQWQERFATLAAGYKMSQEASKAEAQQLKAGGYTTLPTLSEPDYLEVDGIEVSL